MGKKTESHSIRNAVIAAVTAGIILWFIEPARIHILSFLKWVGTCLLAVWRWLWTVHLMPGWLIVLLVLLSLVAAAVIVRRLKGVPDMPFRKYTEDTIKGAKWTWEWGVEGIHSLAAFCPNCEMRLVYREQPFIATTECICENCSDLVVTQFSYGSLSYALGSITREIERRIRTGEYKARLPEEPR